MRVGVGVSVSVGMSVSASVKVRVSMRVSMRMMVSVSPDLPVGAVAAAAHDPGDEGGSRHRWPEDDGGEIIAFFEWHHSNRDQRVWQYDGGESTAAREGKVANMNQSLW